MQKSKYLILGAGPAGLTYANRLKQKGENSFYVIEKESNSGGLCRSEMVDGTEMDIGGGHFLDVRRPEVNKFLFQFMPREEWNYFDRDSRIRIGNMEISHPFEANIWQMPIEKQVEHLKSIAVAGCNTGAPMPEKFIDWIFWKLGEKIASDYMIPYNKKIFSNELNELGTYWLDKLPNVSFEETLMSCLKKSPFGTQPGHAQFYYPKKFGYGELWRRMGESLKPNLLLNAQVEELDILNRTVKCSDGSTFQADYIISTIPWKSFKNITNVPEEFHADITKLCHSSIETRYFSENLNTAAQWIYFPDESLPYHRIMVRHNFCANSSGHWAETRKERISMFKKSDAYTYLNEYAYPLNTVEKPKAIKRILKFSENYNVYGLGRWGEHQHYNSDLVVCKALELADSFMQE